MSRTPNPSAPHEILPPHLPTTPPRGTSYPNHLRPAHAERFRCIASACEDTCCKGWDVPVDQGTYEKYRSNSALKTSLGTLIVLNTNKPTPSDFARIKITGDASCAFLLPEKLCGIQKDLGAEMLSSTCATYPRALSTHSGTLEKALNLSCPEAARLTLLDPNLLAHGLWRIPGATRYTALRRLKTGSSLNDGSDLAVRDFALLLLADRTYPLWQRLYLLGLLTRRIHPAVSTETTARILADSARSAALQDLRPIMDEIQPQSAIQLQLVIELLRIRIAQPPVPSRFIECIQEFEQGLGCATATSEQQILDAYGEACRLYYKPFMDQHPQLLENNLANFIFKNGYPSGRPSSKDHVENSPAPASDPTSEHLALCVHAALTQTLLIGIAAFHREAFSLDHVVKLVQSLARTLEHSREALDQIATFVRTRGLNNPLGIAILLRHP